jgi:hypothetical protein
MVAPGFRTVTRDFAGTHETARSGKTDSNWLNGTRSIAVWASFIQALFSAAKPALQTSRAAKDKEVIPIG